MAADWFACPPSTGADVGVAGAGRVMPVAGASGWVSGVLCVSAVEPLRPRTGSVFVGFGPEDLVEVVSAGIVSFQPTLITLGSLRWAPPGWVVAWDASKISG